MLINWDDKYSVGVTEMDAHHQKLVSMINELHDAMLTGKGKEKIASVLGNMVEYTKFHFAAEENFLNKKGYPEINSQKTAHKGFVEKAEGFQKDLASGKLSLTMEVMSFLKDWLLNHINKSDKAYGTYLKEKGLI